MRNIFYELLIGVGLPLSFVGALFLSAYVRYKKCNYSSTFKDFMKYHCIDEKFLFHVGGIPCLVIAFAMTIRIFMDFQ